VMAFADALEQSVIECIESGLVTKDLMALVTPRPAAHQTTDSFLAAVASKLKAHLGSKNV
jgi:isocitrate dehydrogenase